MTKIKMVLLGAVLLCTGNAMAAERNFTVVSIIVNEAKFWIPSTFHVNKGDKVNLTILNRIPGKGSAHGFSIGAFKIQEVVKDKTMVSFTADKKGIHDMKCHMHPTHIGGQFIVH